MTILLTNPDLSETSLKGLVADSIRDGNRPAVIEWPTILLSLLIYGGWFGLTWFYSVLPLFVFLPLAAIFTLWQSSLQHEVLHGHPTRFRSVNRLFGMPPLNLWLPYERYRQMHLTHHIDERLTDPIDDPESYYWTREDWGRLSAVGQWLVRRQNTLLGRLLIGPYWSVGNFLIEELGHVRRNELNARSIWFEHLLWCVPVILWLTVVCGVPLWLYVLGVAMPATGLMMIRSFAEHRAVPDQQHRTAIVENSWFFGPLFLFNNLHVVHHEAPLMPWYKIPGWYRSNRAAVLTSNGGLVYDSYFEVARRFLLRAHDQPEHPMNRIPRT